MNEIEIEMGLYWIGLDWIGLDWIGRKDQSHAHHQENQNKEEKKLYCLGGS